MSGPVEACPLAPHHGDHEWLANGALRRYCPGDPVPSGAVEPAPWRFDVPEVPPGVTAFEDGGGTVWIRIAEVDRWAKWQVEGGHLYALRELLVFGSLVECPDPRTAA